MIYELKKEDYYTDELNDMIERVRNANQDLDDEKSDYESSERNVLESDPIKTKFKDTIETIEELRDKGFLLMFGEVDTAEFFIPVGESCVKLSQLELEKRQNLYEKSIDKQITDLKKRGIRKTLPQTPSDSPAAKRQLEVLVKNSEITKEKQLAIDQLEKQIQQMVAVVEQAKNRIEALKSLATEVVRKTVSDNLGQFHLALA